MKAAVALAVSLSLLGCFPNNARHRTYAKYAEGAALIAGIAISAVSNTGADCDTDNMNMINADDDCRTKAQWLGTIGVALILGGLLGFVATISTAEDDSESTPRVISVEKKDGTETKDVKLPPGVNPQDGAGSATGSAADPNVPPPAPDPASGSAATPPPS